MILPKKQAPDYSEYRPNTQPGNNLRSKITQTLSRFISWLTPGRPAPQDNQIIKVQSHVLDQIGIISLSNQDYTLRPQVPPSK